MVEATTAGVGRHVIDLSVQQQRLGLEVTVACPLVRESAQRDTAFVDRLCAAGVPVALVPMRRSIHPLADLRALVRLIGLMRQSDYQVIHAHSSKAGVFGRLAARWVRRGTLPAVVYTPNAFAFMSQGRAMARRFYLVVERWLGQRATDVVICVSPSELALAGQYAITTPERLVLLENVIDATQFEPKAGEETRAQFGLDSDRPVVGYVGRLVLQKGVDLLVEAAQRVLAAGVKAQFVVVGEGELERALEHRIATASLQDSVRLLGYQPDIASFFAVLDIFVLPSRYEGLPYTLMEAMAAGRAVVASDVGGNRDLIVSGETGLLVPAEDVTALADTLSALLADPAERARLAAGALAAARARSTPEERARRVVTLYQTILASKQGSKGG